MPTISKKGLSSACSKIFIFLLIENPDYTAPQLRACSINLLRSTPVQNNHYVTLTVNCIFFLVEKTIVDNKYLSHCYALFFSFSPDWYVVVLEILIV